MVEKVKHYSICIQQTQSYVSKSHYSVGDEVFTRGKKS